MLKTKRARVVLFAGSRIVSSVSELIVGENSFVSIVESRFTDILKRRLVEHLSVEEYSVQTTLLFFLLCLAVEGIVVAVIVLLHTYETSQGFLDHTCSGSRLRVFEDFLRTTADFAVCTFHRHAQFISCYTVIGKCFRRNV